MERRCSLIVGTTYWTPLSEKRPAKHFYRRCRGTSGSTCGFSFKKSHAEKVPALYCNGRNAPKVLGAAAHSSRPSISIGDDCFPTFEMARPIFALHRETRSVIRAAQSCVATSLRLLHGRPASGWREKTTKSTGPLSLAWADPLEGFPAGSPSSGWSKGGFSGTKNRVTNRCATMSQEIHTTRKENHASNGY
jgi:hypothetical protein